MLMVSQSSKEDIEIDISQKGLISPIFLSIHYFLQALKVLDVAYIS